MSSTNISNEYEPLEIIGKGSFGTVRKVRQKSDGQILVRKEIEYTSMNVHERNQLISELRILRELNHPNIVKYYRHDHIIDHKTIHIYMEYCDGGDLAQIITNFKKNKEKVPEEFIWQVLVQTLLALYRCHYGVEASKVNLFAGNDDREPTIDSETVIIHRDIKPDNIFLLNSGKSIKLGDFGLAKMLTSNNDFAKTYVGTPYYMSPEVLMDNPYSPVCDIWSLGCVLFELCTLQPPFHAKTHLQLQSKIKKGIVPELPSHYSSQIRSIIKDCITVNPDTRPSCHDLLGTLSIKFLRKEMELIEFNSNLKEFQNQLAKKNEELKNKELYLNNIERKLLLSREEQHQEYSNMEKKFILQKKQFEQEMIEDFEMKKRAMDLEAKEVRLGYQREFKMVVESEVQQRLKELISKQSDVYRIKSDPSISGPQSPSLSAQRLNYEQQRLRGPRDLLEEQQQLQQQQQSQQQQQHQQQQMKRIPLRSRSNEDYDINHNTGQFNKAAPQHTSRFPASSPKKRITDELERLSLEKRNTPEFEEVYLRKNGRH
ncbi:G2-specific serine/threonine protein kinase [Scheffersomyces amazonensis]|uniref:G2-specific serine/threonine protein kinase n=1 Tax=Scheffersomyces amazonensis TaxID=1078765 RepID=UPI00315C65E8